MQVCSQIAGTAAATQPATGRVVWAACLAVLAAVSVARAGVIITEGQLGTAWPNAGPVVDITGSNNPDYFTSGVGIPSGGSASQTFLVTDAFQLDSIDVAYTTSPSSGTVELRLQEAVVALNGGGTAYEYTLGANLLATPSLSFTYTSATAGVEVITLDFTGADEIVLDAGKTYALEFLDPGTTGTGFSLRRRGSSVYADGMVFTNRVSVNGTNTRDAAMQVFDRPIPEPATLAVALLGLGIVTCRRDGR